MKPIPFSLVCPIHNEKHLIPLTLPSFYNIHPSEVILCFDDPPDQETYETAKKISQRHPDTPTRFLFIEKNPEYQFHQALVRRRGFMEAKHDKILTTDIDLILNKNVLKAVQIVGENNIGLVSCSKRYPFKGFQIIWRNLTYEIVRLVYPIRFTGLYALWRPHWLDSEDQNIKNLRNPKNGHLKEASTGEDTYLRNCMVKKHRAVYLKDVGAAVLTPNIEDLPKQQFEAGRYFASQGYNILRILAKAFLYWRLHILLGWLYERRRK